MENYDKFKDIKNKDLDNARMVFRIRTKMVKTTKMNFKNMHKNNLKCAECDMEEYECQENDGGGCYKGKKG